VLNLLKKFASNFLIVFFLLIITVLVSGPGFPFHWFYRFRLQCFHWLRRMHLRCVAVCMISIFFCVCVYMCARVHASCLTFLVISYLLDHILLPSSCFLLYSGYFGNKLKLLMILFSSYTFPGICMIAKFLHTLNLFLLRNFI
jgi:hypothetical protein